MTPLPPRKREGGLVYWYLGVSSLALASLIIIVVILVTRLDKVTGNLQQVTAAQQQANITQCQLANVSRQQDIAIWNRLLQISPAAAAQETAEQKAEVAELRSLVAVKDTPRNCTAAYPDK